MFLKQIVLRKVYYCRRNKNIAEVSQANGDQIQYKFRYSIIIISRYFVSGGFKTSIILQSILGYSYLLESRGIL